MDRWSAARSAAGVQLLVQLAMDHGVPEARVLAGSGIPPERLADPTLEITAAQELAVIRSLQSALPQVPALGLQAGAKYHLTAYGILGFALISSPTLRSAIDVGLRYLDLSFSFNHMYAETRGDMLHLVLDDSEVPEDVRRFVVERDLAAIHNIYRELLSQPVPVSGIRLRASAPPQPEIYTALFGLRPVFSAQDNAVEIGGPWLDAPLPQANAITARACEMQCRELLAWRRVRVGVGEQVRDRLLRQPGAMPDMDAVAAELCMTSRTLRRHLAAEGTSWRGLVDEVRAALAEEMLGAGRLRVADVAERLGYAETASFIHAFQRWKGVPPGSYRRDGRAQKSPPT
jgi:AraC-like DNA-binding protein